jgi:hypothetical protein
VGPTAPRRDRGACQPVESPSTKLSRSRLDGSHPLNRRTFGDVLRRAFEGDHRKKPERLPRLLILASHPVPSTVSRSCQTSEARVASIRTRAGKGLDVAFSSCDSMPSACVCLAVAGELRERESSPRYRSGGHLLVGHDPPLWSHVETDSRPSGSPPLRSRTDTRCPGRSASPVRRSPEKPLRFAALVAFQARGPCGDRRPPSRTGQTAVRAGAAFLVAGRPEASQSSVA